MALVEQVQHGQILFQNTPDVLDPAQREGATGKTAELITHLLARAAHMGLTGDYVIVSSTMPEDFKAYLRQVTGESPEYLYASIHQPLFTRDILQAIPVDSIAEGTTLNPYIQSTTVAEYSNQSGIPLEHTPAEAVLAGVADLANDKAYFRAHANELGIPLVPEQLVLDISDRESIQAAIVDITQRYRGSFVQANKSGGGIGNIDIRLGEHDWQSKLGEGQEAIQAELNNWITEMQNAGSDKILIAPYLDLVASHTVSGYIPAEGEPIVYGVFGQTLDQDSHDYQGYTWPAQDEYVTQYGDQMLEGAKAWFKHLQGLGYVGASDVDYIVGSNPVLGQVLGASESNTRWDAFRFGMQHVGRLQGWNLRTLEGITSEGAPFIRVHDHILTGANSTTEIVQRLTEANLPLLGITNQERGFVLMVPPQTGPRRDHNQIALAVIAHDQDSANQLFHQAEELLAA